jgi:hypothetical protein
VSPHHSNSAPHACYKIALRLLGQGPPGKIPCAQTVVAPTVSDRPPPTFSPMCTRTHNFSTVNIPYVASIIKSNFTFVFSSSHFALCPPLLPLCSSPAVPPMRATNKHHLSVAMLVLPLSCCYRAIARLTAPSVGPCKPELAAALSIRAVQ